MTSRREFLKRSVQAGSIVGVRGLRLSLADVIAGAPVERAPVSEVVRRIVAAL